MKSTLRSLAHLILQNVDALEGSCEERGIDVPSLDEPYTPGSDIINGDPAVIKAINTITTSALQLISTIRPAASSLVQVSAGHVAAGAIRAATELNVPEILREAGPMGLHVKDIAEKCKTDANKLAPVLRILAGHWIFSEVQPEVFANNRLSSVLDKGQNADELVKSPENIYAKPQSAVSALVSNLADQGAKTSAYLYETLSDPATAFADGPQDTAFQRAFNTKKVVWDFYEEPQNKAMLYRFGVAMEGAAKLNPPELAVKAFDWGSVPDGGVVVDVGGGIGTISVCVAKAYPKLKFVVQDRPAVIADGVKRWEVLESKIISSGRVAYQPHDFFASQPIKDASVFFMKHILHDWSDSYAIKILRQLREAAAPETRLFVMDIIVPNTCVPTSDGSSGRDADPASSMPGVLKPELPAPLTNVSGGNTFPHMASISLMLLMNGLERTLQHTVELYHKAGWKIVKVHQFEALGQLSSGIHAVPI